MPSLITNRRRCIFMRTKGQLGAYGTCGCVIRTNLHIVLSSHIVASFPGLPLALSKSWGKGLTAREEGLGTRLLTLMFAVHVVRKVL